MKLDVIRVMDDEGRVVHPDREPKLTSDELRKLFRTIVQIRILDERMLRLQRQGRLGFYLSSIGEEATHIGAAHALRPTDWLYPAYREVGAALYRGYVRHRHRADGRRFEVIAGKVIHADGGQHRFALTRTGPVATVEAFRQAQIIQGETFNYTPLIVAGLLFVLVTIPLARIVDRMQARQPGFAGGVR